MRTRVAAWRGGLLALSALLAAGCLDKTVNNEAEKPVTPVATAPASSLAGAVSTGNKSIRVTFSGPVGGSALEVANYLAVEDSGAGSAGTLTITGAAFAGAANDMVNLTTLSQNGVAYRLSVSNVRDATNTPLAEPRTATFHGTPAEIADLTDTDGDFLFDSEEQAGWTATTLAVTGDARARHVTSSPSRADTDGDGLIDSLEKQMGTDPRDSDSDDDGLGDNHEFAEIYSDPARQDSDGDSVPDGREFNFFKTSPTQRDTDGDQLTDDQEVLLANRKPRAADLPLPAIEIGDVDLRLDARFTATSSQGTRVLEQKSTATTLVQTDRKSFSNTDSNTHEVTAKATIEAEYSAKTDSTGYAVKGSVEAGYTGQWTSSFTSESSSETQRSLVRTRTTDEEVTQQETVERTVNAASMSVEVRIRNIGNIAFNIENLQITALMQDPHDPTTLIPIATLVPDTTAGTPNRFSLGPLVPERGPFLFRNDQIFPALIEDLMTDPRGLVFKVSNYDLTDEVGRNFAFTSQGISDRTSPLVIDYGGADTDGDGEGDKTDRFRLATSAGRPLEDTNGDGRIDSADRRVAYDVTGAAVGITVGEALESIVGLTHYDEDANPVTSLTDQQIQNSYSTRVVNGIAVLWRVRAVSKELGNPLRQWEILTSAGIAARDRDVRSIVIAPESGITFANIQDLDDDLIPSRWEYLYGCSDSNTDSDGDGLGDYLELFGGWTIDVVGRGSYQSYSSCVRIDSDRDGLSDAQETSRQVAGVAAPTDPKSHDTDQDGVSDADEINGYLIDRRFADFAASSGCVEMASPQMSCVSDPLNPDSDGDTLADGDERALGTDPTVNDGERVFDEDGDGLSNFDETTGWTVTFRRVSTEANAEGDVVSCTPQVDNIAECDGATEPTSDTENPDTDGDGVLDGQERTLGLHPRRTDSDGDGIPDSREIATINGVCRGSAMSADTDELDADSDNDMLTDGAEVGAWTNNSWVVRVFGEAPYTACPDPTQADADLDLMVDGAERNLTGPTDPNNHDTDNDGVLDSREALRSTNPLREDQMIDVRFTRIEAQGTCDPFNILDPSASVVGEYQGTFHIDTPNGPEQVFSLAEGQSPAVFRPMVDGQVVTIPADRSRRVILRSGEFVRLHSQGLLECDALVCALSQSGADDLDPVNVTLNYPVTQNLEEVVLNQCTGDPGLATTYTVTVIPD